MTALAGSRALALMRASHAIPTVGVTAFSIVLAAAAGNSPVTCVVLGLAVLTGQLTIGWSNDRLDVVPDRAVGRTDKPLVAGAVALRTVDVAIATATVACVALSLALGWRAGVVHLAAVACGWMYNLWLKGTVASFLPYAAAFGALPAVATLAVPGSPAPAWWAVTAAALLGVAANLTNALPDLERDRQTGFRGLPSRIGAGPSVALALVLLVAAAAAVAFGPAGSPTTAGWVGLAATVIIAAGFAPVALRTARSRVPFYALMLLVPVDLVMIILDGHRLR